MAHSVSNDRWKKRSRLEVPLVGVRRCPHKGLKFLQVTYPKAYTADHVGTTYSRGKLMIITIASFKGGVSKTTTAVHLAAYLQKRSPRLLIDGDPNRSATGWARRGQLPFKVVNERLAAKKTARGSWSRT